MNSTLRFDSLSASEHDASLYRATSTAEPIGPFRPCDEDLRAAYHAVGFLSFYEVLTQSEIKEVGQALVDLVSSPNLPPEVELQFESEAKGKIEDLEPEERLQYVRKFMTFAHVDSRIEKVMRKPEILDFVRVLLGAEPEVYQDMALLKPAGIGREKPWHQDKAYFNVEAETPVVGIWIALDDALPENGGMHFLAGSHREGPIPHFNRRDWQICDSEILKRDAVVATPVYAGGALFFDGLVMHGTPSNQSDKQRRALQFHYIPAGASRTSLEARMALFGAEGKDATC